MSKPNIFDNVEIAATISMCAALRTHADMSYPFWPDNDAHLRCSSASTITTAIHVPFRNIMMNSQQRIHDHTALQQVTERLKEVAGQLEASAQRKERKVKPQVQEPVAKAA